MQKLHGDGLNEMLIQTLVKELEIKGSLHVLRHGFKFYGKPHEAEAPLSELIKTLNDRFGTEFSEDERFFAMQFCERAASDERVIKTAEANTLDKFQLGIKDLLADFMLDAMGDNDKFVTKYMANNAFQSAAFPILAKVIFDSVRDKQTPGKADQ